MKIDWKRVWEKTREGLSRTFGENMWDWTSEYWKYERRTIQRLVEAELKPKRKAVTK